MSLPFSAEQFFGVFEKYNAGVWPAQVVLVALGVFALLGALSRTALGSRLAFSILGCLWIWMGWVYHHLYFARINPVANGFALLFVAGGALLIRQGARAIVPLFELGGSVRALAGLCLAVFGLVVYPLLNPIFGHHYPAAPGFGLPCPTTIFTIGLLSLASPAPPRSVLVFPTTWAFIGATAAFRLGVPQDYVLLLAGAWGILLMVTKRSRSAACDSLHRPRGRSRVPRRGPPADRVRLP